jgi:hypothetical protein
MTIKGYPMPKFHARHHRVIADLLKAKLDEFVAYQATTTQSCVPIATISGLMTAFEKMFKEDNPSFKPSVFRNRVNGV